MFRKEVNGSSTSYHFGKTHEYGMQKKFHMGILPINFSLRIGDYGIFFMPSFSVSWILSPSIYFRWYRSSLSCSLSLSIHLLVVGFQLMVSFTGYKELTTEQLKTEREEDFEMAVNNVKSIIEDTECPTISTQRAIYMLKEN